MASRSTLSTELSSSSNEVQWPDAENPFKLFNPELDSLEQDVLGTFDELEEFRIDLEAEQAELAEQREKLLKEWESLHAAQHELAQQQAAFQLQRQESTNISQISRAELLEWEEKLGAANQEIESLREQIATQTNWAEQHKLERNQHEEQYSALELELEHVRSRAGELFDTLACSRTEWDVERKTWEQERKELQALLAQQQAQITDYLQRHDTHVGDSPAAGNTGEPGIELSTKKEDTVVVGSVLAQFERIRNERAVRRRKAGEGT